jgi:hypothetical protein
MERRQFTREFKLEAGRALVDRRERDGYIDQIELACRNGASCIVSARPRMYRREPHGAKYRRKQR